MSEIETETQGEKPKTSKLAIICALLAAYSMIGAFLFLPMWNYLPLASLIFGIVAILQIKRGKQVLSGLGFAISGVVVSSAVMIYVLIGLTIFYINFHESYDVYECGVNSGKALRKIQRILKAGRLAELPVSTADFKVGGWSGGFTGADYMMFRATAEDINSFIAESPSIKDVAPEVFSCEHMHLLAPENTDFNSKAYYENFIKHKYFHEHSDVPSWYNPIIKTKGRMYKIPSDPNMHNWGEVIINDETNTVYINVIWS